MAMVLWPRLAERIMPYLMTVDGLRQTFETDAAKHSCCTG